MIARQYKNVRTPTQVRIDILVEVTVLIMFLIIPMLFISDAVIQGVSDLQTVRNAVVFVTSLVPQGLVLVAILSLTIGALKISRHQTLVQKVNAVESLANATTLCFDKTGTLTKNELRVTDIIALNSAPKDEIHGQLWQYLQNSGHLNHTSQAVQDYVSERLDAPQFVEKVREIPFSSGRKWGAILFEDETFVMGAPERLLPEHEGENTTIERVRELSNQGMRVLAFARVAGEIDEDRIRQESLPIALVVLGDTIRDDIQETLQSFRDEDIELKVISGDSLETVRAIASQSGLNVTESHTETTLREMSDAEFDATVLKANVFARIEPDTKSRIVESLQKQDRYVAMTGDGVNDVPALKKANLAIVMNDGTQISKDVADIVLLNNAMSTLPLAFVEGREITQTIYGTMKIFLIKNGYTVLLFIFAALMALPFPITPVQISWATFGTINVPATLIAFGIIRPKYMSKFRRDVMDPIFTGSIIGSVALLTLYAAVYLLYDDVMLARSSVTILLTLLSSYMVATVQGVDLYHPRTFIEHGRIVLILTVLAILTIWSMYALPDLFEFKGLTFDDHLPIAIMITALQMLCMILLAHGDKYRYLLRRFWHLFRPDPEDGGREYSGEA
ncbi:MAG: HAD-IC family P-type ATPase [Aggregatilineales bacterium]